MNKSLALSFLFLTIFLNTRPADANVRFDLSSATSSSYKTFIKNLREALPKDGKVYDIPVLLSTVMDSRRFILIDLVNYDGQSITAAIDVLNVYIVAYSTGTVSYFFQQVPAQAPKLLFKGTQQRTLPYTGNYENLQTAAKKLRENIELGLPALDSAITTLFHYNAEAAASALLVLIQTTSEAARFRYIELQIANNVGTKFKPSQTIISLENNWSALSKQIQIAKNKNGQFETPVILIDPQGNRVQITNVTSNVVTQNIKLLLNIGATVDTMAANDDVDEMTSGVPIRLSSCGHEMERKSVENGRHANYVSV
ncbi:ribosome-inactivating protein cucurmosin [Cucurbita moschata]|uniref:rRNA N-glycosylase n=1 Tax=Cucurbita moschata TaxID=3662 RepID=A0A6J1H7R8_CUCMO|nr:rRNA N-glycosylase precursor [Cucurbita moschata]